jgi:hypothetical protein
MSWIRNLSNAIGEAWLVGSGKVAAAPSDSDGRPRDDRSFAGISLHALIRWLEAQPTEQPYEYTAPDRCALAQYLKGLGYSAPDSSIDFGPEPQSADEGFWLHEIVRTQPWTFGAALERARKTALNARGTANSADATSWPVDLPWSVHL